MAGSPIKKRTCALPVSIRAMPENEIPPARRVDFYFAFAGGDGKARLSADSNLRHPRNRYLPGTDGGRGVGTL